MTPEKILELARAIYPDDNVYAMGGIVWVQHIDPPPAKPWPGVPFMIDNATMYHWWTEYGERYVKTVEERFKRQDPDFSHAGTLAEAVGYHVSLTSEGIAEALHELLVKK